MPAVDPADEGRHTPGDEELWNESYYFDFFDEAGTIGGYVRIGLYPNLGAVWYWAAVVGPGRQLVTVIDHEVPLPEPGRLELRSEGLWGDHITETPLEHMTVGAEAFAVGLDDPAETYGALRGDRVPLGFDLEWETDGGTFSYGDVTRYEIPCRVTGEVLVGEESIELDGWGQRDHSWGVRDWWALRWNWNSGRLDDGTRFHATHVTLGDDPVYAIGYRQDPGAPMDEVRQVSRDQTLGDHGFPTESHLALAGLDLTVEPIAFAPVLLTAPDGRQSRFPRALCRVTDTDGRGGLSWAEWNQSG